MLVLKVCGRLWMGVFPRVCTLGLTSGSGTKTVTCCLFAPGCIIENSDMGRTFSSHRDVLCACVRYPSIIHLSAKQGFPGGSVVKNPPAVGETWIPSLTQEDPLDEGMATHSRILAWIIPQREESGGLQAMGSQRAGHGWATNIQPPPVVGKGGSCG